MSAQTSMEDSPAGPAAPDSARGAFRALGLIAVCLGVVALAAATFVLSYAGIRAIALQAGIEPRYARGYPLLIDAMLVIVLAAVLVLRGANLPSQALAWLTLLVVLAVAAGADALHATGRTLTHTTAAITASVLPWALVFLAFVLLLSMLRHARLRRQASVRRQSVPLPTAPRAPLPLPAAPEAVPPPRPEPALPDAGEHGQRPPDLSHIDIGQPDLIQPFVPQQGQTDPVPLPVRTPQPWSSTSVVPGFSRHLASAAAAGAAEAAAAESDPAPEAQDWPGEPGDIEAALGPDESAWAEYSPLPESTAESEDAELSYRAEPAYDTAAADDTALTDEPEPTDEAPTPGPEAAAPAFDAAQPDPDDSVSAPISAAPATLDLVPAEAGPGQASTDEPAAARDGAYADAEPGEADPAPDQHDPGSGEAAEDEDEDMPVFHRMWSSPTPPES